MKQLRGSMALANELAKAQVVFVCVPVLSDADHEILADKVQRRFIQVLHERTKSSRPPHIPKTSEPYSDGLLDEPIASLCYGPLGNLPKSKESAQ